MAGHAKRDEIAGFHRGVQTLHGWRFTMPLVQEGQYGLYLRGSGRLGALFQERPILGMFFVCRAILKRNPQ